MPVVLLGTLDTKGTEFCFVRDLLRARGLETLVIDAGALGEPKCEAEIAAEQVYEAAGTSLDVVLLAGDRGRAVAAAALGAQRIVLDLHRQGRVDGILSLGGSAGTTI